MSVEKEEKGLIYMISCSLIGVDVNLRKSTLGGEFIYNAPRCGKENHLNIDDVNAVLSIGKTDPLYGVQKYQEVAEKWNGKVVRSKDTIAYCIARNMLETEYEGILNLRKSASKTANLKCNFDGEETPFTITVKAKTEAALPTEWLLHAGELTSEMLKEQNQVMKKESLENRFLLYENDPPDVLSRLIKGDELIDALEIRPLTFRGHDKVAFLIHWSDTKNPIQHATDFTNRIVSLQKDVKKASTIGDKLTATLDKVADQFESESMKYYVSDSHHVDMQKLQKDVEKKARRLLADSLLWLDSEIARMVHEEKIGEGD
jgi:hypothetical protein